MSVVSIVPNDAFAKVAADTSGGLSDLELLHAISVDLIVEHDLTTLYGKIVDAAIYITKAQFGTMQLLRSSQDGLDRGLELLTSRGLSPQDRAVWEWVSPSAHSSCTVALKSGRRAVIADFEAWDEIAGTKDLLAFRRAGIRSAQTTPLRSRDGSLLGMISTHWTEPHQPSQRDLQLLDILARQAADLLDRTIQEEALRQREKELEKTVAVLREAEDLQKILTRELGHRVKNLFAMVTAITSHTLRGSSEPARAKTLQQRLMALSSAHDILLQASWKSALLGNVADATINGAGVAGRVRFTGPDIAIGSSASLSVALLLHELTTNAVKYGSLSVAAGAVDVVWQVEQTLTGDVLTLRWTEINGPAVTEPVARGFGSHLINAGLGGSSSVEVAYHSTGLVFEVRAPLCELQDCEETQA